MFWVQRPHGHPHSGAQRHAEHSQDSCVAATVSCAHNLKALLERPAFATTQLSMGSTAGAVR
jgi:hypothetical protein